MPKKITITLSDTAAKFITDMVHHNGITQQGYVANLIDIGIRSEMAEGREQMTFEDHRRDAAEHVLNNFSDLTGHQIEDVNGWEVSANQYACTIFVQAPLEGQPTIKTRLVLTFEKTLVAKAELDGKEFPLSIASPLDVAIMGKDAAERFAAIAPK